MEASSGKHPISNEQFHSLVEQFGSEDDIPLNLIDVAEYQSCNRR